jgi:hypothetical protein
MFGCEIGGSDVSTEAPVQTVVAPDTSIADENADAIVASTMGGISKLTEKIEDLPVIKTDDVPLIGAIASADIDERNIGGIDLTSELDICDEGGSVELNNIGTDSAELRFINCNDEGKVVNGLGYLEISKNAYTLTLNDFTVDDAYFKFATIYYNGNDFDAKISSGYAYVEGQRLDVENLSIVKKGNDLTANSAIKTDCMGSWVTVTTIIPMYVNGTECPTAGHIVVSGSSSELAISFNNDESVDTFIDGVPSEHYNSCLDLPAYKEVCQ